MSKPLLYSIDFSPPVRSVRLTAKAIELDLDIENVDLFKAEHLSEKFLKINPQHTVPVLDDNGDIIWDSHAICTYIIEKYASNDKLYPKDLVKRARVDQRLHFDSGVLFPAVRNANFVIYLGGSVVPDEKIAAIHAALELLESFLKDSDYIVGDNLTVADICCLTTVTCFELHFPIEETKYPNTSRWIKHLSIELPWYNQLVKEPTSTFNVDFQEMKRTNAEAAAAVAAN